MVEVGEAHLWLDWGECHIHETKTGWIIDIFMNDPDK